MDKRKNILICPLEWGLGHAARMIPVAAKLHSLGHNVLIGAGREHLNLFAAELPGLKLIEFRGFRPGYSRVLPQYFAMLLKTPLLLWHIIKEHHKLKELIKQHSVDIVISDNRFGLWNNKVTSVYVTHMPVIPLPRMFRLFEWIGVSLHRAVTGKFDLCFIPDLPGELNVSGRLSHSIKLTDNSRYIGILSRFAPGLKIENEFNFPHDTVILSGPEPQREILKQKLITELRGKEMKTVILEGKPGSAGSPPDGNIIFYSHLNTARMAALIRGSRTVISRSGYTTIMDLISLQKSAMLIPTPGQTEQEYLARLMKERGWFAYITQDRINTYLDLSNIPDSLPEMTAESASLLDKALCEMLEYKH